MCHLRFLLSVNGTKSVSGQGEHLQSNSQVGHEVAVENTQQRHDGQIEESEACELGRG